MDVLSMPIDPSFPCDETPYVSTTRWDCGPFLSYPIRTGNAGIIPFSVREKFPELKSDEPELDAFRQGPQLGLEQMFQTWLFFGLMAEFTDINMREDGSYPTNPDNTQEVLETIYKAHIYRKDDRYFVTGQPFWADGTSFLLRVQSSETRAQRIQYLVKCIHFTNVILSGAHFQVSHALKFSVFALGELLASTCAFAWYRESLFEEGMFLEQIHWSGNFLHSGSHIRSKMLEWGWCISDIYRIEDRRYRLSAMHFLSRLKRLDSRRDHSGCTAYDCKAAQINTATYRTAHASEDCDCSPFNFKAQNVLIGRILRETDTYPVINMKKSANGEQVSLAAEPYHPQVPYVALTHVWADVLGNPFENELPTCQLQKLARILANLQSTVACEKLFSTATRDGRQSGLGDQEGNDQAYRLWIDTICCPVEKVGKRIALQRIADVYRNATHVLVLDSSFSNIKVAEVGITEACLRVLSSSAWMLRLWTLQEGALARRLHFQFSDQTIEGRQSLLSKLYSTVTQEFRNYLIFQSLTSEVNSISSISREKYENTEGAVKVNLCDLQNFLMHRSVSIASDESVCICTLLSLDVEEILYISDNEKRTVRLWQLMAQKYDGLPACVIFHPHPKLKIEGYRWAPRSLLSSGNAKSWNFSRTVRSMSMDKLGHLDSKGLRVNMHGFILDVIPRNSISRISFWDEMTRMSSSDILLTVRDNLTGGIFRIAERHSSSMVLRTNSVEGPLLSSFEVKNEIRQALEQGQCAVIEHPLDGQNTYSYEPKEYLLVKLSKDHLKNETSYVVTSPAAIHAHTIRHMFKVELDRKSVTFWKKIEDLARQVASDKTISNLGSHSGLLNEGCADARDKVIRCMNKHTEEALKSDVAFARAVEKIDYSKADIVREISAASSYEIVAESVPEDQAWIVD